MGPHPDQQDGFRGKRLINHNRGYKSSLLVPVFSHKKTTNLSKNTTFRAIENQMGWGMTEVNGCACVDIGSSVYGAKVIVAMMR